MTKNFRPQMTASVIEGSGLPGNASMKISWKCGISSAPKIAPNEANKRKRKLISLIPKKS